MAEKKPPAGLEACSSGLRRAEDLHAIAEGLRRLGEAVEEMTKLRGDPVRYPSLQDRICRDLDWLKTRLGLLMIHFPELAERVGFALGTNPPQEDVPKEGGKHLTQEEVARP